jgi:hypothetical protein
MTERVQKGDTKRKRRQNDDRTRTQSGKENRKMTDSMREKISVHLKAHKEGVIGAFKIWIALYNLKQDVVEQLDKAAKSSPIKGYLDDGTETQEGFVSHNLKFVNRMGFARQNLAARS